ncbi:MAG: hypothetical protein V3T24_00685, partial [Longimicrobiales bacterium]
MQADQAHELLGLTADSRPDEIRDRFQELHSEYQVRLTNAPTPNLKKLYQEKLQELETAFRVLSEGQSAGVEDLPAAQPVYDFTDKAATAPPHTATPTTSPVPTPEAASASLLIWVNVDAVVKVDGREIGVVEAEEARTVPIGVGEHLVQAAAATGTDRWLVVVEFTGPGQKWVRVELDVEIVAEAPTGAGPPSLETPRSSPRPAPRPVAHTEEEVEKPVPVGGTPGAARPETPEGMRSETPEPSTRRGQSPRLGSEKPTVSRPLAVAVAATTLAVAAAALVFWPRNNDPWRGQPVILSTIGTGSQTRLADLSNGTALSISPDGNDIVFVGVSNTGRWGTQLWQARTNRRYEPTPIPDTDGARSPFFSPDGDWVAFETQSGVIRRVPLAGGPAIVVATAGTGRSTDWGPEGAIYYYEDGSVISRVHLDPAAEWDWDILMLADFVGTEHRWIDVLPDGNGALFTLWRGEAATASIAAVDFATGEIRELIEGLRGGPRARYAASGHIVYNTVDDADPTSALIMAQRFDPMLLQTAGVAQRVLELPTGGGSLEFTVADNGSLLYLSPENAQTRVVWVDREGRAAPSDWVGQLHDPALSPDGEVLALGDGSDVWLMGGLSYVS